jgi:hypothetical protein
VNKKFQETLSEDKFSLPRIKKQFMGQSASLTQEAKFYRSPYAVTHVDASALVASITKGSVSGSIGGQGAAAAAAAAAASAASATVVSAASKETGEVVDPSTEQQEQEQEQELEEAVTVPVPTATGGPLNSNKNNNKRNNKKKNKN